MAINDNYLYHNLAAQAAQAALAVILIAVGCCMMFQVKWHIG